MSPYLYKKKDGKNKSETNELGYLSGCDGGKDWKESRSLWGGIRDERGILF